MIDAILALRLEICRLETPEILGTRKGSTAWKSAFGARHYQPHVKVSGPLGGMPRGMPYDLTDIGEGFRASLRTIEFGSFEVRLRPRRSDWAPVSGGECPWG